MEYADRLKNYEAPPTIELQVLIIIIHYANIQQVLPVIA